VRLSRQAAREQAGPPEARAASRLSGDLPANHAAGRLVQTSFLGNILRHVVEIEPGLHVTVDVQNANAGAFHAAGESVVLSWQVSDSVILQR
jgi:hypothetical protein